jgi:DnaJ family protein C protein 19
LDKYRPIWKMANSLILAGFGMAALGMSGRIAARSAPRAISNIENLIKSMPLQNWSKAWANSKYYKGGFQLKMTKREVCNFS